MVYVLCTIIVIFAATLSCWTIYVRRQQRHEKFMITMLNFPEMLNSVV